MLVYVGLACGFNTLLSPSSSRLAIRQRAAPVRCDADRCYYGRVDEDGQVLKGSGVVVEEGPAVKPNSGLSPEEVVDAQFKGLSRGPVQNREGVSGVEDALEFVSPGIKEQYSLDLPKYKRILQGAAFDGLIGCAEWNVLSTSEPSEDKCVVTLRVLPKPVAGCVRTSGVADQSGITWPTNYEWTLVRQSAEPYAGCWMVEQMAPARIPIDVDSRGAALELEQAE